MQILYTQPSLSRMQKSKPLHSRQIGFMIFILFIGFCNEKIKLYKASQLTKVENPRPQDEDETRKLCQSGGGAYSS